MEAPPVPHPPASDPIYAQPVLPPPVPYQTQQTVSSFGEVVRGAAAAANADQQTALDPSTDPQILAAIVQHRPDLRAAVAMNPATYSALLAWLGDLSDPVVAAALAARTRTTLPAPPPAVPAPPPAVPAPPVSQEWSATRRDPDVTQQEVQASAFVTRLWQSINGTGERPDEPAPAPVVMGSAELVKRAFSHGKRAFARNPKSFFALGLGSGVLLLVLSPLLGELQATGMALDASGNWMWDEPTAFESFLASMITAAASALITVWFATAALHVARGAELTPGLGFRVPNYGPAFLTAFLMTGSVFLGASSSSGVGVLLLILGVVAYFFLVYGPFFAIDRQLSFTDSVKAGAAFFRSNARPLLLLEFALGATMGLAVLVAWVLLISLAFAGVVGMVVAVVAILAGATAVNSLVMNANAFAYRTLTGQVVDTPMF